MFSRAAERWFSDEGSPSGVMECVMLRPEAIAVAGADDRAKSLHQDSQSPSPAPIFVPLRAGEIDSDPADDQYDQTCQRRPRLTQASETSPQGRPRAAPMN